MHGGVEVEVDEQVVFEFVDLLHLAQVPRLEPGVEEDGRLFDVLRRKHDGVELQVLGGHELLLFDQLLVQDLADLPLLDRVDLGIDVLLVLDEQLVGFFDHFQLPCSVPQSLNFRKLVEIIELLWSDERRFNRLLGVVQRGNS